MKELVLFTIATLAVWRDTIMAVEEEGPFSIFAKARERIDPFQKTWIGRGINCSWCVSVWSSLLWAIWLWYFGWIETSLIPIWWFGMSGGSVLLSCAVERMQRRR